MKSLKLGSALVLSFAAFASASAEEGMTGKMATEIQLGVDSASTGATAKGGVGFGAGVHQSYFFSDRFGVIAGVDYAARPIHLLTTTGKETVGWLEIPVGLTFDVTTGMAMAGVTAYLDVGGVYQMNLKDASSDAAVGNYNGGFGLFFTGKSFYKVNEQFKVGAYATVKYSLFSQFESLPDVHGLALGLGATAAMSF